MIYTVTFNPALDYVVKMDSLELGMVNRSKSEAIFYGGKGINVSFQTNKLWFSLKTWKRVSVSHISVDKMCFSGNRILICKCVTVTCVRISVIAL